MKQIINKQKTKWTKEEDKLLRKIAEINKFKNWKKTAKFFPGKTYVQCLYRYKRIKPGINKGPWKKEEDDKLLKLYKNYGNKWSIIEKKMKNRTNKQIRDRYINCLDPNLNKTKFLPSEDKIIIKLRKKYGNRWTKIAENLTGRTGDMIKNRFYSYLCNNINKEEKDIIIESKKDIKSSNKISINNKNKNIENIKKKIELKISKEINFSIIITKKEIKNRFYNSSYPYLFDINEMNSTDDYDDNFYSANEYLNSDLNNVNRVSNLNKDFLSINRERIFSNSQEEYYDNINYLSK